MKLKLVDGDGKKGAQTRLRVLSTGPDQDSALPRNP